MRTRLIRLLESKRVVMGVSLFVGVVAQVAALLLATPRADGVMLADPTLLTISMITNEALMVLRNQLTFTRRVSRKYDRSFGIDGAKIGDTINVRKPVRYIVNHGQALQLQDATETSVPVRLTTQAQVAFQFSSKDLALSISDFSRRFVTPAVASIANDIDFNGLQLYKDVADAVGTPAVTPSAALTYLNVGVALDNNACPADGQRSAVISPLMQATIVDALKGLFQNSQALARQYTKGQMGEFANLMFYMDQNVASHTVGALGGTPLMNGATVDGATSLVTDGWTASVASVLKRGDVITVALVNKVNPQNRQSVGALQQFVVTADVDSDAGGNATIPIYPPVVSTGAQQTVDALPADGAAILIFGDASAHAGKVTRQGLAFHPDAFTCVTADLPLYKGTDMAARMGDDDTGMSIRLIRDYSIKDDAAPARLDVLFGWAALRPELAVRILG